MELTDNKYCKELIHQEVKKKIIKCSLQANRALEGPNHFWLAYTQPVVPDTTQHSVHSIWRDRGFDLEHISLHLQN